MPRANATGRANAGRASGNNSNSLFVEEGPPTPQKRNMKPEPASNEDDEDDEELGISGDESDDGDGLANFNIQETLPTPTTTRRRLSYLLDLMDQGLIDLNPDYQREVVWTVERQSGLINSVIENFYIPPVIFNIESRPIRHGAKGSDSSELVRVCVDGKQRLSSIHKFVHGEVCCTDMEDQKWWWTRSGNRRVVDQAFKDAFLNKVFICVEYEDLNMDQQEELFGRVQKGMVLTEAEKLKARRGPWQDFANDIEEDFKAVVNLSQNKRGSGFRNVLSTVAQIMELETIDTRMDRRSANTPALQSTAPNLRKFTDNWGDKCTIESTNSITWIFRLWEEIRSADPEIFRTGSLDHAKKFAPIEFVAVGTLLWRYGHYRSIMMLRGDVRALRNWVRDKNLDLRSNSKVWRDCWAFIDHLEGHRGDSGDWRDHGILPVFAPNGDIYKPSAAEKKASRNTVPVTAIMFRVRNGISSPVNRTPASKEKAKPKGPPPSTQGRSAGKRPETATLPTKPNAIATSATAATIPAKPKTTASSANQTTSSAPVHKSTLPPSTSRTTRSRPMALPSHSSRPIMASTMRTSYSSDDDDEDDDSPAPRRPRAPIAPMSTGSDSGSGKRKRLPVETTPGASSLLNKRSRAGAQGHGGRK